MLNSGPMYPYREITPKIELTLNPGVLASRVHHLS